MDLPTLKLLAARVRGLLEQSHHRIGHNQALDLIAALPGLRNWPEVKAFPDRVAACQLDEVSATRLGTQLKYRFGLDMAAPSLLSSLLVVSTTPPFLTILDEFGYYADVPDDRLREVLREVESVPMVSYRVIEGQVFVFDKLVHDLKALSGEGPRDRLPELAAQLLPQAIVSPMEAVERWGVVPQPYERLPGAAGALTVIRHRPFNARVPGTFPTDHDVRRAFARLIVGGVQEGSGDFTYRGQPLVLCDPLDPALLPQRPVFPVVEASDTYGFTALGHIDYVPGFAPVSEATFTRIKLLEAAWRGESARSARQVYDRLAELWSLAGEFQLTSLNALPNEVPEYAREDFAELRPLYPELAMLSDGALFSMFDNYQMECCYINGWTASRDSDFLLYLLGYVAGGLGSERAKNVGEWVAAAMLDGSTFDLAKAFGLACDRYDSDIARLARRVADAMTFLASDKDATVLQGHEITTTAERFRQARSMHSGTVIFEQDVADLSATDTPRG
ncbi:hypothetical protein [Variovorax gossypii]